MSNLSNLFKFAIFNAFKIALISACKIGFFLVWLMHADTTFLVTGSTIIALIGSSPKLRAFFDNFKSKSV